MTDRIVLIKLGDTHATDDGRAEVAAETRRVLPEVPGVREVRVGTPSDPKSLASWDLSIVVRFQAAADIPAYIDHPAHRAYVDEFLRPRMDCIKAWNFEVSDCRSPIGIE